MAVSVVTWLGLSASVGGGLFYIFYPICLGVVLDLILTLDNGGVLRALYIEPPFKVASNYYLFELKNPDQFKSGFKPLLGLRGPYEYRTKFVRDNVTFLDSNRIMSYDSYRVARMDFEGSQDLDEEFYHINPVVPVAAVRIKSIVFDKLPFVRFVEPIVFNTVTLVLKQYGESLVVKGSARKYLDGQKVRLLEIVQSLASRFGLGGVINGPPDDVFGVVYIVNKTIDPMEIYTGMSPNGKKFQVRKWHGRERMNLWTGRCNNIEGTNGELYDPKLRPGKPLRVFLAQLCRTFDLEPTEGERKIQFGLSALEYKIPNKIFKGVRSYPSNKCYCDDVRTYDCQLDGLARMSPCYYDVPVYISKLDMEEADERIRGFLEKGSLENQLPWKQSIYLDPITAAVMKADLSFLVSLKVVRHNFMQDLARVQNLTYYPLFAASEYFEMPFSYSMMIRALQVVNGNYKPASVFAAAGGALVVLTKFFTTGL